MSTTEQATEVTGEAPRTLADAFAEADHVEALDYHGPLLAIAASADLPTLSDAEIRRSGNPLKRLKMLSQVAAQKAAAQHAEKLLPFREQKTADAITEDMAVAVLARALATVASRHDGLADEADRLATLASKQGAKVRAEQTKHQAARDAHESAMNGTQTTIDAAAELDSLRRRHNWIKDEPHE